MGYAFNAFNFFFYNQVVGLSGTLCGLAVTIALVFDAVSDPFVGSLSDRWRSRLGRRHPFMLAAPLPVFLCFFGIYSPPAGWSEAVWLGIEGVPVFLWFTAFTIAFRTSMTLFHVPHLAMGAELSTDYQERTSVMTVNMLFGVLGAIPIVLVGFGYFFRTTPEFDNGLLNGAVYTPFALFAASLGVVVMLASALLTLKQIPRMPKAPDDLPPFRFVHVFQEMRGAWRNRNYRMLLLGLLFLSGTLGMRETISLHVYTFFWELRPDQLKFLWVPAVSGFVIAVMATPPLHRRFDKKPTIVGAVAALAFFSALPVTLRILGLFPDNGTPSVFPLLMGLVSLQSASGGTLLISVMSSLADIVDEHELTTHRRQEGIFYSARTFFSKATSGLGHLLAGIAIDVIQFPIGAAPGSVDPEKLFALGLVDGPIAAIPALIAIGFYVQYRITRESHQDIQRELATRAAASP